MHVIEPNLYQHTWKTSIIVATRAKMENNPTMEAMAKLHADPLTVKNKAKRWKESTTWQNIKLDTHKNITYQTFKNNPILKKSLLETGEKWLFECTMDRFYGVGYTLPQRHRIKKSRQSRERGPNSHESSRLHTNGRKHRC